MHTASCDSLVGCLGLSWQLSSFRIMDRTACSAWPNGAGSMWTLWTFQFQCSWPAVLPMVFDCSPPMRYFDGSTWWALQPLRWFLPSMPFSCMGHGWKCIKRMVGLLLLNPWGPTVGHRFVSFLCLAVPWGRHRGVWSDACNRAAEKGQRDPFVTWASRARLRDFPMQWFSWGTKPCPSNSTSWPAHVHYSLPTLGTHSACHAKAWDGAMWYPAYTRFAGTFLGCPPSFAKGQADPDCSLVNVYSAACGGPLMLGGGKLPHPSLKCVQSSLCEPNPVRRRTAAAMRTPLRRRLRNTNDLIIS